MKILKATVLTENSVRALDVIEYQDALWLVTGWMTQNTEKLMRPKRIIRLTDLQFERVNQPGAHAFVVTLLIPGNVIDGLIPPEEARDFVVVDAPSIAFERPRGSSRTMCINMQTT